MKCKRIAWETTWAKERRASHEYYRKFWKRTSPYSRRCRMCARALASLNKNPDIFIIESARVSSWIGIKTRWQ